MRARLLAAPAALVVLASLLVAVSGSAPAAGLPGTCERTWVTNGGDTNWENSGNWTPVGVPSVGEVICISTSEDVVIDAAGQGDFHVDEVHLEGTTTLDIGQGAGLYVDGAAESVWGPGTSVIATMSQLGGSGTIRVQGAVTFASGEFGTFLTSVQDGSGDPPPADTGQLVVEGTATLSNLGLGVYTGYHVTIASGGLVTLAPNAFVAADYGTGLTVQPGGALELAGDGDYHQGFAVTGQPLSLLTNNGLLRKTAGTGTSVVDATYAGSGQVAVQSGTLAMPDNQQVGASVSPGTTFATGRCEGIGAACQPTTDPAKDTMSVAFTVPGSNAGPAVVQLQELGQVADPQGIGNEVLAHADNLSAAQPARIELRYSQADVMDTPPGEVQVVHISDAGAQTQIPPCVGGAVPAGSPACLLSVARDAENTYVTVLAVQTSRWRLRRGQPVPPPPSAPSAPQGLVVKEAAPYDGSVLQMTWSPPASSGAGAVTSYAVRLDDTVAATPAGTSVVLKNPGPGQHKIAVAAVNAAGQGTPALSSYTVAGLSKPRKVAELRGAAGGKLTAGAKWKAPADAGGYAITKFKVMVLTGGGKKVDTEIVKAGKLKYLFKLKPGRYVFKVRARNTDRWGPWSKPTDVVRPR